MEKRQIGKKRNPDRMFCRVSARVKSKRANVTRLLIKEGRREEILFFQKSLTSWGKGVGTRADPEGGRKDVVIDDQGGGTNVPSLPLGQQIRGSGIYWVGKEKKRFLSSRKEEKCANRLLGKISEGV